MSAPINDGGPVFPTPAGIQHNDGMTLRDYFAAAALQGILADGDGRCRADDAKNAFKAADAMLKARGAK